MVLTEVAVGERPNLLVSVIDKVAQKRSKQLDNDLKHRSRHEPFFVTR